MPSVHIAFRSIRQVFHDGIVALSNIDLDVCWGQFVCLLGPSGCGKSTLLNIAAGFQRPTNGEVFVDGVPVKGPEPRRAMVFQEYGLFPWMTVAHNVAFGLENAGLPKPDVQSRVEKLLETCGLSDFAQAYPKELSGGMKQRVAIARALALKPPILLLDEPFAALDALTRRTLQDELLRLWSESGMTVLFVTHSIEEAMHLADRIVVLTYRPGTIKCDMAVSLPRPRDASLAEHIRLRKQVESTVMEEQDRFVKAEARR